MHERLPVAIIDNPGLRDAHPDLAAELFSRPNINSVHVELTSYPDGTPNPLVAIKPNRRLVVPGLVSGRHGPDQLAYLTQAGFVLNAQVPSDPRTPRTAHGSVLLYDFEGRGNKPTIRPDGQVREEAELLFTLYAAKMLKEAGLYGSAFVVDPHDREGLGIFGESVVSLTVLPELIRYFEANIWRNHNYGLVIADDGAIGRTLWTSIRLEIPIIARIVKVRRNGQVKIEAIYGGENVKGHKPLLVEDMLSSGNTSGEDANALADLGALGTTVLATHVKDVEGNEANIQALLHGDKHIPGGLEHVVVSNTTPFALRLARLEAVHTVDVLGALADLTETIVNPTPSGLSSLREHIFPMRTKPGMIAAFHHEYPDLTPDYRQEFEIEEPPLEAQLLNTLEEMGIW
jgi:phosphoribosylpyrophosphate synthetase